jgi:hypothetical protein
MIEKDLGIEPLCMFQHSLHQIRTLKAFNVTRPVIDVGGRRQLTALLNSGDDHRAEVGAGGIDCGCVSGRPGSYY